MKTFPLLIAVTLMTLNLCLAQKKNNQTEPMPTQKELNDMMKEMQKQMDDLDPETKKMMDSMGIKMPSMNSIPDVSDAQLQQAMEDENRIVPLKNTAKIASISKVPLTSSTVSAFIISAHTKVLTKLKPAVKTKGEEIYTLVKSQYSSPRATGNSAVALWLMGKVELALYVMGKACTDDPANTDNMNNYASMLSMSGGEPLAIPLLDLLNKRYPDNSTILNNIGQAWFALGEIEKANEYLDHTIRLCAFHPQANYTKSFIEESKDHQALAVEAVKRSIKNALTQEKANRLRKLGYKLEPEDLSWDRPMPQDPLGLQRFKWPAYPMTVKESEVLEKEWNLFRETCTRDLAELSGKQNELENKMLKADQERIQKVLSAGQKGIMVDPMPRFAYKANIKLKYLIDGKDGQLAHSYQKKTEAWVASYLNTGPAEDKLETQFKALDEKYEDLFGEGKPNPFEAACSDYNSALNLFLSTTNSSLQMASTDYLNFLRRKLDDETYYYQYTMWPEQFEVAKNHAKMTWLTSIRDQKVMFRNPHSTCNEKTVAKQTSNKLAEFDDVHCEYHSQLKLWSGSISVDCSRMTTELSLSFIKLGLKQDMNKETFGDQFMSCSVEVGAGASAGVDMGPLKAEASIGGALAMEFDRNGVSDVIIKTSAGVSAGTNVIEGGSMAGQGVSDLSLEVGVKGQISMISGKSSVESTGILDGAFKK